MKKILFANFWFAAVLIFSITPTMGQIQFLGNASAPAEPLETEIAAQKFEIELLPALPSAWPNGSVIGLRAQGGFEVDMTWSEGKLANVKIKSDGDRKATVRYDDRIAEIQLKPRETVQLNSEFQLVAKSS